MNDQLNSFLEFRDSLDCNNVINIGKYTGAMSTDEKRQVRNSNPKIVLTNPEMVHLALLPWKHQWFKFLKNLRFIVIDESHYYRGVVGSNFANLIRRLYRVCNYYGSNPQFICCSATIGNPKKHAELLTNQKFVVVDTDGSGHGAQKFIFWNPPFYKNEKGFNERKSYYTQSAKLFLRLVQSSYQSLVFVDNRQAVERMYRWRWLK